MIVAEVSFVPIGKGESVGSYVLEAIDELKRSRLNIMPNSMATVIEAETLDEIFEAVKKAESAIFQMGVSRVDTFLKIDHRIDKENSAEIKMQRIRLGTGN